MAISPELHVTRTLNVACSLPAPGPLPRPRSLCRFVPLDVAAALGADRLVAACVVLLAVVLWTSGVVVIVIVDRRL